MAISEAQGNRIAAALHGRGVAACPAFGVTLKPKKSAIVREANPERNGLKIINCGNTVVWVTLGPKAVFGKGIPLAGADRDGTHGGEVLIGNGGLNYNGPVSAIHEGESTALLCGAEV